MKFTATFALFICTLIGIATSVVPIPQVEELLVRDGDVGLPEHPGGSFYQTIEGQIIHPSIHRRCSSSPLGVTTRCYPLKVAQRGWVVWLLLWGFVLRCSCAISLLFARDKQIIAHSL
ncbi:uncharacterized protein B0H18DRAFT_986846, partial [Fomitopsis serialis]|uniref:uncharacterized protein n=1 Tax=Fomitopsis serialis TaxID=139415 RepID=UPI00200897EC